MGAMNRIRLDLAYLGTPFHGWARQPGLPTVCGVVETALSTIFRQPVELTVAGRTDTGVHATAQVAHFDLPATVLRQLAGERHESSSQIDDEDVVHAWVEKLPRRINGVIDYQLKNLREGRHLGAPVVIHRAQLVDTAFDARFSAKARHYLYRIADRVEGFDPTTSLTTWWVDKTLDVDLMNEAGTVLVGEHDFLSLCKPREGATTVRTLSSVKVQRRGSAVEVAVSADAFCHSMVRSLVGVLTEVGWGRRDLVWVEALVEDPSRQHGVPIVPAHGLTLVGVDYPAADQWARQQEVTRRVRNSPLKPPCL